MQKDDATWSRWKIFQIQRILLYRLSLKTILVNDILLSDSPFGNQVTLHIYIPCVKQLLVSLLVDAELFSILCIHAFSSASFQVIYGIRFLPTYRKRKVVFYSSFFSQTAACLDENLAVCTTLHARICLLTLVFILRETCWSVLSNPIIWVPLVRLAACISISIYDVTVLLIKMRDEYPVSAGFEQK